MLNVKKIRPLFDKIVVTMDKYAVDEYIGSSSLIDAAKTSGTVKEFQKVVSVGNMVREIKVGDIVCIDPKDYAIHKYKPNSLKQDMMEDVIIGYNFKIVEIDHIPHLILKDRDIVYVVEESEEEKEPSPIINFNNDIITP